MVKLEPRAGNSSRPQTNQTAASGTANRWKTFLMTLMRTLSSGVV